MGWFFPDKGEGVKQVKDIMTRNVETLTKEATIAEAVAKMHEGGITCVIVVGDKYAPIGIITGRDIIRCLGERKDLNSTKVADEMTSPVVSVTSDYGILKASRMMKKKGIKQLPITEGKRLAGIVTHTDIMHKYFTF